MHTNQPAWYIKQYCESPSLLLLVNAVFLQLHLRSLFYLQFLCLKSSILHTVYAYIDDLLKCSGCQFKFGQMSLQYYKKTVYMHNKTHEVRWKLHIQHSLKVCWYWIIDLSYGGHWAAVVHWLGYLASYLTNMPSYGTVQAQNRTCSQVSFAHAVIITNKRGIAPILIASICHAINCWWTNGVPQPFNSSRRKCLLVGKHDIEFGQYHSNKPVRGIRLHMGLLRCSADSHCSETKLQVYFWHTSSDMLML